MLIEIRVRLSPGIVPCACGIGQGFPCEKLPFQAKSVRIGQFFSAGCWRETVRLRQRAPARHSVFRTEGMMALRLRVGNYDCLDLSASRNHF